MMKVLLIPIAFMLIVGMAPLAAAEVPPENMLDSIYETIVSPFTDLMDDWFYAGIFMLLIGAIYIKSESWGPPTAIMIIVGGTTLFTGVLNPSVRSFFAIMAALGVGVMLVNVYRGRG